MFHVWSWITVLFGALTHNYRGVRELEEQAERFWSGLRWDFPDTMERQWFINCNEKIAEE